ncbi:ribosomal protein S12 methylthiotransferase RimO [Kineosphaera limosa]|uniref:Ribosomal protein uS12 methylthiotransferase RimO n=1 Tax=Kineosphaera limosa NBRC 100340 TaxID=1184609 RepID=K6W536_9MICO|nr:30S ribosomal protein S12 methylthiotransferase RimO [Kineosphaera limosa]NYE02845.1 ribosomal protein S12 methylthiotransferase RimO [Kineosphaera limosa]GAB94275.1 ribosomal protein S12 methylthiotransferase RimO [Kineosphaera limosa NBRC 100340]
MSSSVLRAGAQRSDGSLVGDERPTAPGDSVGDGLRRVAIVSLGCSRNDVDSEELAGRLQANGWQLVAEPADADVAVVNTCGFVEQAKKDSIDTILALHDLKGSARTSAVVAVGCLAERYGRELADELPEADAVLGFDSYTEMSAQLRGILEGERPVAHVPRDRRTLLPIAPSARPVAAAQLAVPGHGGGAGGFPAGGASVLRARLDNRPWAPLKIASGCDRRCAFCAIPAFRGSFVSRHPDEVLAEARWLADQGVREVLLVSENSTSYGKDLGDLRLLDRLLPQLASVDGLDVVRVSYLQPAEMRPDLIDVMTSTPKVAPYFDLSFQHASGPLLRRMRRFGDRESFLRLIETIRDRVPQAGIRCNVIVGFPGESQADVEQLCGFIADAGLDAIGVFGYSDEDGTEAEGLDGHLPQEVIDERVERISDLVEAAVAARAADRVGDQVSVLIESEDADAEGLMGRALHQGPEVDGTCLIVAPEDSAYAVGHVVSGVVVDSDGVDLVVRADATVPA